MEHMEAEMKKAFLIIISLFVVLSCFAEDYTFKKVAVFDNTKEGLVRRPPVEVGDDCELIWILL